MCRMLMLAALAAGGAAWSAGEAGAQQFHHQNRAFTSSVTWPSVNPPGWYTNTSKNLWYFPWYANYDFTHGPYSNWYLNGGYAGYGYHGPAGYFNYPVGVAEPWFDWYGAPRGAYTGSQSAPATAPGTTPAAPTPAPGTLVPGAAPGEVSVTLPADAKLLFNGAAATGSGAVRTFRTPELQPGQSYRYELTAEVTRDGRTERVTGTVVVRAGETAKVTLAPSGVAPAGGSK